MTTDLWPIGQRRQLAAWLTAELAVWLTAELAAMFLSGRLDQNWIPENGSERNKTQTHQLYREKTYQSEIKTNFKPWALSYV